LCYKNEEDIYDLSCENGVVSTMKMKDKPFTDDPGNVHCIPEKMNELLK